MARRNTSRPARPPLRNRRTPHSHHPTHLPDNDRIRRALLAGIPAHDQPAAKRQLNALTQAGGTSLAGLTAILADPTRPDDLRTTAARLLGVLNRPAALAPLLAAANDPNPEVRWQSILSLGLLRDPRALPPLIDLLAATADSTLRSIIIHAIGCIGAPAAVAELIRLLTLPTEDPAVRGAAAEQLGLIHDRTAVPVLLAALQDSTVEVRFWSAFALGQLGVKRAIPPSKPSPSAIPASSPNSPRSSAPLVPQTPRCASAARAVDKCDR